MATTRKKKLFDGLDMNEQLPDWARQALSQVDPNAAAPSADKDPSFIRGDGSDAIGPGPGWLTRLGDTVAQQQPQQPEAVPAMAAPASGGMFRGLAPDGGPPVQTLGGMVPGTPVSNGPAPYPKLAGSLPALPPSNPDVTGVGFANRPSVGLQAAPREDQSQQAQQQPAPTGSEETYNKIMDLEKNYQDPHKHSLLGRLFGGLGKAWQQWDGQGGIVGLAETMLAGGIGSAKDPKNYAELEKRGEQQKLFRTLGIQQQRESYVNKEAKTQSEAANQYNQIGNRNATTMLNISKADHDRFDDAQKNLIAIWKESPTYKRGQDKALDAKIDAAKLVLPDKQANGRYTGSYAPDGTYRVLNTQTGESQDQGNYAKPTSISEKDLPDELFGLASDKDIGDRAAAAVGKLPEGRELSPDAASKLPEFAAPDGTFDEAKYWKAVADRDTDIKPSDIYNKLPDNYEQKVAGQRIALRDQQKDLRTHVAEFRSAMQTYKPLPDAVTLPLPKVVDGFKQILQIKDPKKRAAALKSYYSEILPHIKVG